MSMGNPKSKLAIIYFISVALVLAPFISFGQNSGKNGFATVTGDLLNPDKLFEVLKNKITLPLFKGKEVNLPTTSDALKEAAPQLKEISSGIKEETGIDLSKFLSWIAKILKVFFQIIINLLEQVSKTLGS